jgi:hypothetical protein
MSRSGCLVPLIVLIAAIPVGFVYLPGSVPIVLLAIMLGVHAVRRAAEDERRRFREERARFQSITEPVGAAWRALLAAEGLGAHVAALAPHVRPAVRVTTQKTDTLPPGTSHFGGRPDLPEDLVWPRVDGRPLAFLAQIDLADVARVQPAGPLRAGHLWFFYDAKEQPWGFDASHAGGSRVLFRGPGTVLQPSAAPPDATETFPLCALTFEAYEDPPGLDNETPPIPLEEAADEAYRAIRSFLSSGIGGTAHKLLGHADPIQGPMEPECIRLAGAGDWTLLLQLESDDTAGMSWGDLGRLYFWIRRTDLAAGRFDRIWTLLQCH